MTSGADSTGQSSDNRINNEGVINNAELSSSASGSAVDGNTEAVSNSGSSTDPGSVPTEDFPRF